MKKIRLFAALFACVAMLSGCSKKNPSEKQVIIYSNADDEAVVSVKKALDENGFAGKYIFQSFGTSELGGKLFAEGSDIEADLITMSSFYIESAQKMNNMFKDLVFETNSTDTYPAFYTPLLAIQGAVIVNTKLLKENKIPYPKSIIRYPYIVLTGSENRCNNLVNIGVNITTIIQFTLVTVP